MWLQFNFTSFFVVPVCEFSCSKTSKISQIDEIESEFEYNISRYRNGFN